MLPDDTTALTGPLYSVVIPVYGSAPILPELVRRLDLFFDAAGHRKELVFVVDGSPDESWDTLCRLKGDRADMVLIDLIRNYGQHSAVFCGLQHASGDFVITIDDDLQNPPEEIAHLIRKADEGYDVVFGEFHQKMHGVLRRLGSRAVRWLNTRLFGKPRKLVLTNVRIIRRHVVDAVCGFRTTAPYITGLLLMTGKTFANVPIEHHPRPLGRSNYGVRTIAALVWRLVFNYSAFPPPPVMRFGTLRGDAQLRLWVLLPHPWSVGWLGNSWVAHPGRPALFLPRHGADDLGSDRGVSGPNPRGRIRARGVSGS